MPERVLLDPVLNTMLALLPEAGGYFSVVKIIPLLLGVLLWAHTSVWVQTDTAKIRVPAGLWTGLVFGSGLLCLIAWLLVPVYWAGLAIFVLLYGAAAIAYVIFRNRRVAPAETVLTMAHFQRLGKGSSAKTTEAKHSKDRARIRNHEGKPVKWPTDKDAHAGYEALQDLLFDAIWRRASNVRLDLIPQQPVKVIYKVDGVDRRREPIEPEMGIQIVQHLKRIAGLNPEEHRRPQNGRFSAAIGAEGDAERAVDVEVKTSGSTAGQRMSLRMIAEESKFRLPDLGFTKDQLPIMESLVAKTKGVLLCSGPRGSGVSSTLYAILRSHDVFIQNIHTLEVNKTMDLENISQHVFDSQDGAVSFGKRLRSILRTEPDICMASSIPDGETASLIAHAVRQNKKVYAGVSAKDTFSALRRYLHWVGDPSLAASGLLAITCQRLVRVLCQECRRGYKPDPRLLKKANLPQDSKRPFYRPPNTNELEVDKQGNPIPCPVCQGSGYLGRTAVFELLLLDEDLRRLIASGTSLSGVRAEVRKRGMLYLQEVALHRVYEGITSINEVLRVTKEGA